MALKGSNDDHETSILSSPLSEAWSDAGLEGLAVDMWPGRKTSEKQWVKLADDQGESLSSVAGTGSVQSTTQENHSHWSVTNGEMSMGLEDKPVVWLENEAPSSDEISTSKLLESDTAKKLRNKISPHAELKDGPNRTELSGSSTTTPVKRKSPGSNSDGDRVSQQRTQPARFKADVYDKKPVQKASLKLEKESPARKRQPIRGNWTSIHLLQSSKSKLANENLDLVKLLSHERAWSELTRAEQIQLFSMLPGAPTPSLTHHKLFLDSLREHIRTNSSFQADIRLFQDDLRAGRYDPQWQKDAQAAMEKRARGEMDDWKEKNREEFWGQKQKVDHSALAGESSQHNLQTLVAKGLFQVGDVWLLQRGVGQKKSAGKVEKEATITAISGDNKLSFEYPPGQHKHSSHNNGPDLTLTDVDGPLQLSNAMLREDGRIQNRGANSWKEFRCSRKHQDMGSLFDIRELYHSRQTAKFSK